MKIIKDENNQQWEVYTLKKWSFLLLVPLAYDLIVSLLQVASLNLPEMPYGWVGIGVVAFFVINADYLWMVRVGVVPGQGQTVTSKKTPFKIWIKKTSNESDRDASKTY